METHDQSSFKLHFLMFPCKLCNQKYSYQKFTFSPRNQIKHFSPFYFSIFLPMQSHITA